MYLNVQKLFNIMNKLFHIKSKNLKKKKKIEIKKDRKQK